MPRRPLLAAIAFAGLVVGVLVASVIGSAPGGHRPGALEWVIQVAIILAAIVLVAGRVRGKG
ncbi:MAG TPA: hypothetical protein VGG31_08515 [Candidatus Dormibacteraeota bacterium]|jgi:hypothetical protein